MRRQQSRSRSLVTALTWPFGVALTSWHYMWRTTPLHRREKHGAAAADIPSPVADSGPEGDLQPANDGVGPLFHRRYRIRIADPQMSATELMACITAEPDCVAPTEFARFKKVKGQPGRMRVGDEFVVRMPGPWNGPVRVVAVASDSFRLATLRGHLEAGQIEFRVRDDAGTGEIVFEIESWARSGDRLSRLLHQTLRMAKEVQLHMWTSFLERAARLAGGRLRGGVDIETRRLEEGEYEGRRTKRMLDELHGKAVNFELGERASYNADTGWKVDEYCQPLPSESPGEPVPGGSWETAQELMRNYEFASPKIVRAVYHRDRPLEERDMLLEARFYGLRFRFGVRIGGVVDETRQVDGRAVRVWGWNYRTLQGHLEMGQMDYEVWKWLDTGEVEFHTCRFSRHAPVANPIVRLGLALFGRRQQVRFAKEACRRMVRLTEAAMESGARAGKADNVPRLAEHVKVRSQSTP